MGIMLSKLKAHFSGDFNVLMVGLDGAGKTTILYKLSYVDSAIQTVDNQAVETVIYQNFSLTVWDLGDQERNRSAVRQRVFQKTQGIILVVDSNDREKIG